MSFAGQTIEAARRSLAARFRTNQIDSADLDARILVGAVLGLDFTGMIASVGRLVTADQSMRLDDLARRRLAGEPVARLLGHTEFWSLPLKVSTATLVPRPDTETVVEFALEILCARRDRKQPWRIADIGTGSGAILLALLSDLPAASGVGTDISAAALKTAHANAIDLELSDRVVFVACSHTAALAGPFDLIVSNPPYIRSAEINLLATEVRDHDPRQALDGGIDGLDAYRALIPQAARLLAPYGALVVEVGHGQSRDIEGFMAAAQLTLNGPAKADLAGTQRAVAGLKLPP